MFKCRVAMEITGELPDWDLPNWFTQITTKGLHTPHPPKIGSDGRKCNCGTIQGKKAKIGHSECYSAANESCSASPGS